MNQVSPTHSIKAAAQSTGLSVETLRAWERRYAAVSPYRDTNGRRLYSTSELVRLRLLRKATEMGHPISKLADLQEESLRQLLDDAASDQHAQQAWMLVQRVLRGVEHYRQDECYQTLEMAMVMLTPSDMVSRVLSPVLQEVGDRWESGEFSIAQERLLSGAVHSLITSLINTYRKTSAGSSIVFATLSEERHELGLLMSAYLAASRGLKSHYMGAGLPAEEIARAAQYTESNRVAISAVSRNNEAARVTELTDLCHALEGRAEVWVGGAAAESLVSATQAENCTYLADQRSFEESLESMLLDTAG